MAQHARPIGPTTNAAATFSAEMAAGTHPPGRSRFYTPVHRQGLIVSQTTHVPAAFSPSMAQGWAPSEPIVSKPFSRGGVVTPPDVLLFSLEMVQGSRPERARVLLGPQIGQPVSQTTHVASAFSAEMADGSAPDRNRAFTPPKLGGTWWTPEVDPFSIEMIVGCRPDRPRILLGPRIALPVSQTTPVAAFSVESAVGVTAPRMRYTAPFHQGVSVWTPDVLIFSVEMVAGSRPDRPRLTAGKQIGQPVSQTTHVAAPFSSPMAYGVTWQRPSRWRTLKPDGHYTVNTTPVLPFNVAWVQFNTYVGPWDRDPK